MLVREEEREGQEAPGLRVLAREYGLQEGDSHPQGMMRYWSALTREEWMESADMLTMSSIIADIKVKRSGVRVLTVNGVPNIAAYGDIGSGNIALLLLVPRAEATKDADSAEAFVLERVRRELIFSGIVMGGAILAVVIVAVYLSRRFTSRIEKLAKGFNLVSKGDFSVRLKVTGKDELGRLARGFNVMVPSLEEHIRMSKAMDVASEIQQQFLPAEPPQVCGLEIAATSIYSESMGGDYYDFMPCEQDCRNLAMAVGDVTGHGLPAALLMTTARGYLRQRAAMPGGPPRSWKPSTGSSAGTWIRPADSLPCSTRSGIRIPGYSPGGAQGTIPRCSWIRNPESLPSFRVRVCPWVPWRTGFTSSGNRNCSPASCSL